MTFSSDRARRTPRRRSRARSSILPSAAGLNRVSIPAGENAFERGVEIVRHRARTLDAVWTSAIVVICLLAAASGNRAQQPARGAAPQAPAAAEGRGRGP